MGRYNLRPRNANGRVSSGQKYTSVHLRLLSADLREAIFKPLLLRSDGKTPALLIALRSDDELYSQAVSIYYAINEFEVRGVEWMSHLGKDIPGLMKRVVVIIP